MDPNPISAVGKTAEQIGDAFDNNFESGEERQGQLTERLRIDMASDSMLSKNIRPAILIYLVSAHFIILVASILGYKVPEVVSIEVTSLLFAAFGFYFNSKKGERIYEKKVKGSIDLEEKKQRHEMRLEERKQKHELKLATKKERREARRSGKIFRSRGKK